MRIIGWDLLTVCQYPDKFGDHRLGETDDTTALICLVTFCAHIFKGLC